MKNASNPNPRWKTYPMGAAAAEKMRLRNLTAYRSHAVRQPAHLEAKALCGVHTSSLCMDSSLATSELPDCPRCAAKAKAMAQPKARHPWNRSFDREQALRAAKAAAEGRAL